MDPVVQQLVTDLSNGQADVTEMQDLYTDVLGMLANFPILTNFLTVTNPSTGIVNFPASASALLFAFYNNEQLGELSIREADWLYPDWPEQTGVPENYVWQSFNQRQFQLVPIPIDGANAQLIVAETRNVLPSWLQLPVALLILYYEYSRESNHRDLQLSQACQALGMFLIQTILS